MSYTNNYLKGIAAIFSGVTILVVAAAFVYGNQIRQTAGIKSQTSAARFFGGYSKNVQAPKLTRYRSVPYEPTETSSGTVTDSVGTASLFFNGGGNRRECIDGCADSYLACANGGGDSDVCSNYWLGNSNDPPVNGDNPYTTDYSGWYPSPGGGELSCVGKCKVYTAPLVY